MLYVRAYFLLIAIYAKPQFYIFTLLISRFSREQVFYTILTGFLVYFALFLFVLPFFLLGFIFILIPNYNLILLTAFVESFLKNSSPAYQQ